MKAVRKELRQELASVRISERSLRVPVPALEAYVKRLEEEARIEVDGH